MMLNPDETMAREFDRVLAEDFPNARLKHEPHPKPNGATTVSQDIEALQAKLALIARGIEMLKGQL